jgi:uncharacterized heparinase superfamily protein
VSALYSGEARIFRIAAQLADEPFLIMPSRVRLYIETVRHLRARQIVGRLRRQVEGLLPTSLVSPPDDLTSSLLSPRVPFLETSPPASVTNAEAGVFSFLNHRLELGRPVNWSPEASALWVFNLHYFDYMHTLTEPEKKRLCLEWIEAHPELSPPAWHPFTLSRRIVNWCKAGIDDARIRRSLYQQAELLSRRVETHILGNHLLENARALVFAGCYFHRDERAQAWLKQGLRLYEHETPEQILPDGGHMERSPMYHMLMLQVYIEVLSILPTRSGVTQTLQNSVRRMTEWLQAIVQPDGTVPLFNDAARNVGPSPRRLLAYADRLLDAMSRETEAARPAGSSITRSSLIEAGPSADSQSQHAVVRYLESTGYVCITDGDLSMRMDIGAAGPDYLLAHAHADIFSFVLHARGRPWIVDTGTSTYEHGDVRTYERSTTAHNTVTVDGVDQIECWAGFRVARRYRPEGTVRQVDAETVQILGTFDGYADLIGDDIQHQREVTVHSAERMIHVSDVVRGRGVHTAASRLHLHPDVRVRQASGRIELISGNETIAVEAQTSVDIQTTWYAPEFGKRDPRKTLVFEQRGPLPAKVSYRIVY